MEFLQLFCATVGQGMIPTNRKNVGENGRHAFKCSVYNKGYVP